MLVIFALMLTALLGSLALVFDIGYGLVERRTVQNYADSAAMAGAQTVSDNSPPTVTILDSNVYKAISDVTTETGLASANLHITTPDSVGTTPGDVYLVAQYVQGDGTALSTNTYVANTSNNLDTSAMGVKTTVTVTYSTFFAPVIGIKAVKVVATATAVGQYVIPSGIVGLNPFAARWDPPYGPSNNPTNNYTNPSYFANKIDAAKGCSTTSQDNWQCYTKNASDPKITGIVGAADGVTGIPIGTVFTVYDNGSRWQSDNVGPSGPTADADWGASSSISSAFKGFFNQGLQNNCWNGNTAQGQGVAGGRAPTVNSKGVGYFPLIDWAHDNGSNLWANVYGLVPLKVTTSGNLIQGSLVYSGSWIQDASCGSNSLPPPGTKTPFISVVMLS